MGTPIIQTPNIDQLARQGTLFQNNFCATAICCTSRANIFTGRYGTPLGLHRFDKPLPEEAWRQSYPMLLKAAGYRTGFIGKFGIGDPLPKDDFDFWRGYSGQGRYFEDPDGKGVHLTRRMSGQALEFLEGCTSEHPFCLSVSFKAPHVDDAATVNLFPPDPADLGLYAKDVIPEPKTATDAAWKRMPGFLRESEGHVRWQTRFGTPAMFQDTAKNIYRLITGVDRAIGEMIAKLEERGLRENTLIVFTSDNGFFMGERRFEGKWLVYEESIRTPLIVFDPRLPATLRGRRLDPMTLNLDIAPTLLDFAGLEPPALMRGRSLRPLLYGEDTDWRKEWFYEHHFEHPKIPRSEGVRTERWKYIRYLDTAPLYEEIYDLSADPLEQTNLVAEEAHKETLMGLRERWRVLKGQIG
jgi:arylsulfatase A-like enzyme